MKKTLKRCVLGMLTAAMVTGGSMCYAEDTVRIVIDGNELIPTDVNGNRVDPIIIDGTTYLPVRAVANAFGKAVYWDGSNYTVYLGDMGGKLDYPTTLLSDVDNIGDSLRIVGSDGLTDNYGNSYSYAYQGGGIWGNSDVTFETLLNMKYKRFKTTLYVPKGCNSDSIAKILIKADGKIIYTSPEITKTSSPINVDVDITGCNNFQIEVTSGGDLGYIADGGFYQ